MQHESGALVIGVNTDVRVDEVVARGGVLSGAFMAMGHKVVLFKIFDFLDSFPGAF